MFCAFTAYEYICVTSSPELLLAVARGERRCRANGKSVAPAQTAGRTMLKARPCEGIIIKVQTLVLQVQILV